MSAEISRDDSRRTLHTTCPSCRQPFDGRGESDRCDACDTQAREDDWRDRMSDDQRASVDRWADDAPYPNVTPDDWAAADESTVR